jgi:hypothetical protein
MAQKRAGSPISFKNPTMTAVDDSGKNRLCWRLMSLPEITDAGSLGVCRLGNFHRSVSGG